MPFDGIVAKCVAYELNKMLTGARIEKIYQPEPDEVILHIRSSGCSYKLLLSASASYPRIHITSASRENPKEPPMFCMLLRKHLSGGKIITVDSHDYERMLTIRAESLNELGDASLKKLIIEIMGRHSNIILVNSNDKIIDSIKHIDSEISSLREVMPARPYLLPPSQDKESISSFEPVLFASTLSSASVSFPDTAAEKYLLAKYRGFSPLLCREICHQSGVPPALPIGRFSPGMTADMADKIAVLADLLAHDNYAPCIIGSGIPDKAPLDFHCIKITHLGLAEQTDTVNEAIDRYFTERDRLNRLKQKKADILKVVNTNLERSLKKKAIHDEKISESSGRDKLKLYGELLTANIHSIPGNTASVTLTNYYDENSGTVEIQLDPALTPQRNAQKYFKLYSKAKSACVHAKKQLSATLDEIEYLESVLHNIEECNTAEGISEIRAELSVSGYVKTPPFNNSDGRKNRKSPSSSSASAAASSPTHYLIYEDAHPEKAYDVFVGRNNVQNDKLTMKQASPADLWLHAQKTPGSHVIIRRSGMPEPPESIIVKAARIAAWNSRARMSSNVPVDYAPVKNVKKPPGAKPGMVIYDKYRTIIVTPDESFIRSLREIK